MHSENKRYYGLGMDALVTARTRNTNRTLSWFGHGSSGYRMHSEHERQYNLGMDALLIGCTRNANVILVWAWMLW